MANQQSVTHIVQLLLEHGTDTASVFQFVTHVRAPRVSGRSRAQPASRRSPNPGCNCLQSYLQTWPFVHVYTFFFDISRLREVALNPAWSLGLDPSHLRRWTLDIESVRWFFHHRSEKFEPAANGLWNQVNWFFWKQQKALIIKSFWVLYASRNKIKIDQWWSRKLF